MRLSDRQYQSLIAIICAMIATMMVLTIVLTKGEQTPDGVVESLTESEITASETAVVEEVTEEVTESVTKEPIIEESTELVEVSIMPEWSEYELMARCVWAEARGESYAGQVAVAEVILNRVKHHDFPDSVYDVIYECGQFACTPYLGQATPTAEQYQAVEDAMSGRGVLDNPNCVYFSVGSSCGTYYTTIGNHVFGCEY